MHRRSSVIYKLEIRFVHVHTNKSNIKVITGSIESCTAHRTFENVHVSCRTTCALEQCSCIDAYILPELHF